MVTRTKLTAVVVLVSVFLLSNAAAAFAKEKDDFASAFFFMEKANINLSKLIEDVEKSEKGQAISVKIESKEDIPFQCEIKLLRDGKAFEVKAEPETGKILATESEGLFSRSWDDDEKTPSKTKLSLKDAISLVEKSYNGRALRGNFKEKSGIEMYRLMVANNDGVFTVLVDANSGELFRTSTRSGHDDHD